MKKPRFLCIAPYEGMYHLMTNIAAQRDGAWLSLCMDNAVRRDPDRTQSNRIGLRACRKLLEQMHGQFITHEENGRFCAELLLPAGSAAVTEERPQPPTE